MRLIIFFAAALSLSLGTIPPRNGIELINMGLKSDKHYKEKTISKELLLGDGLSESDIASFPDRLKSFYANYSDAYEGQLFDCKRSIDNLKSSFRTYANSRGDVDVNSDEDFKKFWKKKLKSCYGKYVQSSPELFFKFSNLDKKNYQLSEVKVHTYAGQKNKAVTTEYFANVDVGRELLVIKTGEGAQDQVCSLRKTYGVDKSSFTLELIFFTDEHWAGDFEKESYLIDLTFEFQHTSGTKHVKTAPFVIQM